MLVYGHSRGGAAIAGVVAPAQLVPAALPAPVCAAVVEVTSLPGTALTVSNTGQCVPAEQVSALFEPFRQLTADRPRWRRRLGLSIVRSITARIAARSRPAPARGA
jgi:signal transduction histidine kinase